MHDTDINYLQSTERRRERRRRKEGSKEGTRENWVLVGMDNGDGNGYGTSYGNGYGYGHLKHLSLSITAIAIYPTSTIFILVNSGVLTGGGIRHDNPADTPADPQAIYGCGAPISAHRTRTSPPRVVVLMLVLMLVLVDIVWKEKQNEK